jgi:sodium-dependent phosphate cotransporter
VSYWCYYMDGSQKCGDCMAARERKRVTLVDLPNDMDYLKEKMALLIEHTALPEDEDEKENTAGDEEVEA